MPERDGFGPDQPYRAQRVVVRYLGDSPNGSARDIAGICNERGNVVGLMPHPEHCVEELTGPGTDGLAMFTSAVAALTSA